MERALIGPLSCETDTGLLYSAPLAWNPAAVDTHHATGPRLEPPLAFLCRFKVLRVARCVRLRKDTTTSGFIFTLLLVGVIFTLRLLALVATLLLALLAAKTRTGSRLVALREDHIASQEASLADCNAAAGSDLAFLDDRRSSS